MVAVTHPFPADGTRCGCRTAPAKRVRGHADRAGIGPRFVRILNALFCRGSSVAVFPAMLSCEMVKCSQINMLIIRFLRPFHPH